MVEPSTKNKILPRSAGRQADRCNVRGFLFKLPEFRAFLAELMVFRVVFIAPVELRTSLDEPGNKYIKIDLSQLIRLSNKMSYEYC